MNGRAKELFPAWETRLPGTQAALAQAHCPAGATARAAGAEFERLMHCGEVLNLLPKGDFSQGPDPAPRPAASADWERDGAPAQWSFWQEEVSKGTFTWDQAAGAARAAGVRSGVFIQAAPVRPGEGFYVAARSRTQGKGAPALDIAWKKADLSLLGVQTHKVVFLPVEEAGPEGWSTWGTWATAPAEAGFMVLMLGAASQPITEDVLWWDEVQLVRLP
ncbi:MAG: hypothetical protein FJY95_03805 [Candidatus Handelsmanbacteria bacterium]|nr:hypothetical protein [Candidatus Handelsmanbacteria bacterium]